MHKSIIIFFLCNQPARMHSIGKQISQSVRAFSQDRAALKTPPAWTPRLPTILRQGRTSQAGCPYLDSLKLQVNPESLKGPFSGDFQRVRRGVRGLKELNWPFCPLVVGGSLGLKRHSREFIPLSGLSCCELGQLL